MEKDIRRSAKPASYPEFSGWCIINLFNTLHKPETTCWYADSGTQPATLRVCLMQNDMAKIFGDDWMLPWLLVSSEIGMCDKQESKWFYNTYGIKVYRVSQEECAILRESVPYVKLYRYNPKHLYPKLNGYGDNGQWSLKLWQLLTHLLITKYILKLAGICGFCNVNICT